MDDPTGRTSRGYSVSARGAFNSNDYSASQSGPPLALNTALAGDAHRPAGRALPDPFDLADDPDDDGSQPTPTRTFFAFRPENARTGSRPGSRAHSRATSRATSRAGSPAPAPSLVSAAGRSGAQSRSTSRAASRRPSLTESPSQGESSKPTLTLPQLTSAYLFLPLPNTDPLSTLLSKFVPVHLRPPRDIDGHYDGQTMEQLVASGSWRALARLARDTIVTCDPENVALIFDMFHLRHLALLHLHLPSLHARELAFLFQAMNDLPPTLRTLIAERSAVPFGLEVMLAQTKGVDALNGLVQRCKNAVRRTTVADERAIWRERQRRVGVVLAGLLIDLGESVAALQLLEPLARSTSAPPYVLLALHRLHLLIGDITAAGRTRDRIDASTEASVSEKAVAGALESLAQGEWEATGSRLASVLQNTPPDSTEALVAATTLSVSQLYGNDPDMAIATLEAAINASPSAALVEPLIFNITTLYELRLGTSAAMEKKIGLLVKVAQWEGDGLRPACLKLV